VPYASMPPAVAPATSECVSFSVLGAIRMKQGGKQSPAFDGGIVVIGHLADGTFNVFNRHSTQEHTQEFRRMRPFSVSCLRI